MIQEHQRPVTKYKFWLTDSFTFGFSAAQPSPSTVPKTEDQRPQLGMFQGT